MSIDEIVDNFTLLDEWDDRYRYLIELGRMLTPVARRRPRRRQQGAGLRQPGLDDHRSFARRRGGPDAHLRGDSDAHIVRGLIASVRALSGKPARDIVALDAVALFEKLGLREHLTPQRSNGFRAMVNPRRIRGRTRARRLVRRVGSRRFRKFALRT